MGAFVSAEVYLKLLLPHVEDFTSCSSASPWAPLTVLGAILRGSSREALQPHLIKIGDTLAHPEVCQGSQQVRDNELSAFYMLLSAQCPKSVHTVTAKTSIHVFFNQICQFWLF